MPLNCPHCQSLVAADPATGAAPEHCPYCDGVLGERSVDDTAAADQVEAEVAATDLAEDTAADADAQADDAANETAQPAESLLAAADAGVESGDLEIKPFAAAPLRKKNTHPSFARRRAASSTMRRARWPGPLAACLLLLLALQLVVADRVSLAASPRWRAGAIGMCRVLRCDIPAWREVGAFTMLDRDVRAHPAAVNALRVRAAFRNDARWPQPWPELVLTLSDATGRVTGSRSFTAMEYLGQAPTQKLIASGQSASVVLDVVEPAPGTVSFSFDFR